MSEENKPKLEFPSFVGHESIPQPRVETNEPVEDGVIIERPITVDERAAMEEELQHNTPQAEAMPSEVAVIENRPVSHPENLETLSGAQTSDHIETKLKEDNPFDNVTEAHDAVNALLRGETKP